MFESDFPLRRTKSDRVRIEIRGSGVNQVAVRKTDAACFHRCNDMIPIATVAKEIVGMVSTISETSSKVALSKLVRFLLENLPNCSVATREKAGPTSLGSYIKEVG